MRKGRMYIFILSAIVTLFIFLMACSLKAMATEPTEASTASTEVIETSASSTELTEASEASTEVLATSTDAFTVGKDATVEQHLKNIECLLLIIVVFLVSFIVHSLFRGMFNKLSK